MLIKVKIKITLPIVNTTVSHWGVNQHIWTRGKKTRYIRIEKGSGKTLSILGTSLVVQWLGSKLPMHGAQVPSPVGELDPARHN